MSKMALGTIVRSAWLNGTLNVERGIVHQVIDDVKTPESERLMYSG